MDLLAHKGKRLISRKRDVDKCGGDLLLRLFESEWFNSWICLQVCPRKSNTMNAAPLAERNPPAHDKAFPLFGAVVTLFAVPIPASQLRRRGLPVQQAERAARALHRAIPAAVCVLSSK